MRILHVTHNFPRWPGDFSGTFLMALAKEQVGLGHEVTVLAPHAPGAPERATEHGVDVFRFRYGTDAQETLAYTGTLHEIVRRSWRGRWRLLNFLGAEARATGTLVRALAPHTVHVHWWFPNGFAVWPRRPAGVRTVVITTHGTDVFLLRKMRWLRPLARQLLRSADAVTGVSRLLADDLRDLGVTRVSVIPMPLDGEVHGAAPVATGGREAGHLLFVGRLSAQKGTDQLVRAFALLATTRPLARLTIVGDGPERPMLSELVASLGLSERITFAGVRTPQEVAALYRSAAVLAIPATTGRLGELEGFGQVAVEAMLAGLPVVATSTGGLVDIIDHEDTGLLVGERDPVALAHALGRLLDDADLAESLATRGRRSALDRFSPTALAQAYVALYEQAANDSGH